MAAARQIQRERFAQNHIRTNAEAEGELLDMVATLFFLAVYAITHSIALAVAAGMALALGQIGWELARGRSIDALQWFGLVVIVSLGTATLVSGNPLFVMLKPSLIYVAVGLVMLKPGWMTRYMPAIVQENGADIVKVYGYLWSLLMFATAAANAYVAYNYDMTTYAWFLGVVPAASKIAMFAVTYLGIRILVRRRVTAAMGAAQAA